jgi:hypothetical protein
MARSGRSVGFIVLLVATLAAWAPLVAVLIAYAIASPLDCRVDEGSSHPCVVAGVDLGPMLYLLGVSGWFMLVTWPLILVTAAIWLFLGIRGLLRRLGGTGRS